MYFLTNLVNSITSPIRSIFHWITRYTPGLKNLPRISLAMRLAIMTFLFLFIVGIAAVVSYSWSDTAVKNWLEWLIAFPLIFIIPVIVYYLVKLWMTKEESLFPEIDRLWQAAWDQCEQNAIFPNNVPVFLVIGAHSHRQASQLMRASQIQFSVTVPNNEDSDIIFFANSEAVFIYLNGCSCLSGVSSPSSASLAAVTQASATATSGTIPKGTIDASAMVDSAVTDPTEPAPNHLQGTLTETPTSGSQAESALQPAAAGLGGTLLLPDGYSMADIVGSSDKHRSVPQLSSQEISQRNLKLGHVCKLLKDLRQNLCPINGLLSILPFELIEDASSQVQTMAQKDLAILRENLQVRCANTVLITHLEREDGFLELVKRVGEHKAKEFRFGKGCELWAVPERTRLEAVASHAVGAFEDWIYMLFQQENALKHRYNSRLFSLLCRIRGRFASNLREVLGGGFGFDPQEAGELAKKQFLFGGCYFAAAGTDPSRQAFVKSVLLKGIQQEGELEWVPEARRQDRQLQFIANLFALIGMVSLLGIILMVLWNWGLLGGQA